MEFYWYFFMGHWLVFFWGWIIAAFIFMGIWVVGHEIYFRIERRRYRRSIKT